MIYVYADLGVFLILMNSIYFGEGRRVGSPQLIIA